MGLQGPWPLIQHFCYEILPHSALTDWLNWANKIHGPKGWVAGWLAGWSVQTHFCVHSGSVESVSQSRVWQHLCLCLNMVCFERWKQRIVNKEAKSTPNILWFIRWWSHSNLCCQAEHHRYLSLFGQVWNVIIWGPNVNVKDSNKNE